MKFSEIEKGMLVRDRWYWDWGYGKVTKKLKTVVFINFSGVGKVTFDQSHVQFLSKVEEE